LEALKALDELRKTQDFLDLDNNEIITHALVDLLVRTGSA
jgi:hypothetical protein